MARGVEVAHNGTRVDNTSRVTTRNAAGMASVATGFAPFRLFPAVARERFAALTVHKGLRRQLL